MSKPNTVKTNFWMRNPPKRPTRNKKSASHYIGYSTKLGPGLDTLLRKAQEVVSGQPGYDFLTKDWLLQNLDKVSVAGYGISISFPESEAEMKPRLDEYKKKVEEYKQWRKDNAEAIALHENKLAMEKAERERRREERIKQRRERQKQQLRKKMEDAAKQLAELKAQETK